MLKLLITYPRPSIKPEHASSTRMKAIYLVVTGLYYITPAKVTDLDSYGAYPSVNIFTQLLKKTRALKNKTLDIHTRRLQGNRNTCGLYCSFHILTLVNKRHSLDSFQDHLDFNDRMVDSLDLT